MVVGLFPEMGNLIANQSSTQRTATNPPLRTTTLPSNALMMSPRLMTKRLQSNCPAHRTSQRPSTLPELTAISLPELLIFSSIEKLIATLLSRINQCLLLNDEYQNAFHHVRDNLKLNPSGRQFDFSENYIFGKFDTYCNRLRKLVRLLDLMDKFAVLNDLKVEGIETIVLRYKSLCENMNKKSFDGVDQNRRDFEKELDGFKGQFDLIEQQLKEFLDQWFSKPFSVERQLAMLAKFHKLDFCHLGLPEKYMLVLDNYMAELNAIRHLYEQQKVDPPIARNMTPIAGKIYWARHLYTQIDVPMQQLKEHSSEILLTPEGQKCVRQFNRIASALVEFEVLYHHHWCNSVEQLHTGLSSSLLTRDPDCSSTLFVNFDMGVLESICEARYIQALGLTIPRAAERLLMQEHEIKQRYSVCHATRRKHEGWATVRIFKLREGVSESRARVQTTPCVANKRSAVAPFRCLAAMPPEGSTRAGILTEMVNGTNKAFDAVPSTLLPLFQPYIERVHKALAPGLIMLSWSSTNIDDYVNKVNEELAAFQLLTKRCVDILQCRIEGVLKAMRTTNLCELVTDEAITLDQFIQNARTTTKLAGESLARQSSLVECALSDLVELLKENLTTEQRTNLSAEEGYECIPNGTRKSRCLECLPCAYFTFLSHVTQKNTDALIRNSVPQLTSTYMNSNWTDIDRYTHLHINWVFTKDATEFLFHDSVRSTLDAIRLRLQPKQTSYLRTAEPEVSVPLFKVDLTLTIPNVTIKPSIEELQTGLSTVTKGILRAPEAVQPWQHMLMCQEQQQRVSFRQLILRFIHTLLTPFAVRILLISFPSFSFSIVQEMKRLSEKALEQKKHTQSTIKPLHRIIAEHKEVLKLVGQLNGVFNACKEEVNQFIQSHSKYSELWTSDPQIRVEEFMKTNPNLSDFDTRLHHYLRLEQSIKSIPSARPVEALLIQTDEFKSGLIRECQLWRRCYGSALNQRCAAQMSKTLELFDNLSKRLSRPVNDLDDVREQMAVLSELREAEVQIDMTISPIEESYALLSRYDIYFNDGNAERVDSLSYGYSKLRQQSREVQDILLQVQPKFELELIEGVKLFKENLDNFVMDYDTKGPMEPGIAPREASDRMSLFQANFDELYNKYVTYSGGEELFGMPITEYPGLHRIRRELSLLQKLYQLYNTVLDTVSGYYDLPWADVNIESINQQLLEFQNKCRKLPKALKEWKAFEELSKTIDDFNLTCPLLEMMTNKAMGPSHWKRIEDLTGHKFNVQSDSCLLRNIMEAPLLQFKEDIEDICIAAVKERDIEAKLKAVINDWAAQNLHFSSFKTRGELLLKGDSTTEVISLMEDSLMVLGSLLSNRYNAPYKTKIQEWVQKLTLTSEVLENWMIVQNLWVYLEAVFVSGDIARQLPQSSLKSLLSEVQMILQGSHLHNNIHRCLPYFSLLSQEAKRFSNIDKSWQRIMQRAHEIPNVISCCAGDDIMGQMLPHLLEQLELCQKSLTGYLEKKRLVFPRFFFVSDPALLEILGQASDSHTIQAHLLAIFDNTKTVTFDEKVYDKILAVNSQEGETIQLDPPVMAQGHVEVWLGDLLRVSRQSLQAVIRDAYFALNETPFDLLEFERTFPAQVGLLGIQLLWTRDAQLALQQAKYDRKLMQTTNASFLSLLNQLISVTTQDLSKIDRVKFETLVTIHVHQRDIFDSLVKMNIKSPKDFEWLKQSRFYFIEDSEQCLVSITDVNFIYQNEFLGCTDRLVITPLTDRLVSLGMSLGGAPAGPAGTGKTETTKDMGRCLGKYVVVFNCSDQMDYRGLGRIYKGLAQSGSWGCFDEFNRIELPVLSVAAQQIAIVLTCKKERKSQFIFTDGDVVDLDPEFGIFLTMNPGYAGRQELPENLKINFRTVAMMVPDRAIIMRVKLAACGFLNNIDLSKKFFTLYKLCEEQLSKQVPSRPFFFIATSHYTVSEQVHYDFGLRNILSVLRTLGASKRASPQDSETTIVMRVLRDMNLSKLVDEDEPLFMSLILDLFPGINLEKKGHPEVEATLAKQVDQLGLIYHPPWVLKCIQLYETLLVRHGMMTLGPSGAGKTKCINALMKTLTELGEPHREMRMNPKAITAAQMFGRLDVATNDWTDGIFSTLWRRTHKLKKGEHVWLILDGPVDAIWIENLNSVLDDNKTLTLANGDRIPMAVNAKILFEVHNIDNASPATVSRNGMVFMSSSVMTWEPIVKGWLRTRSSLVRDKIYATFDGFFEEAHRYVTQSLGPKMQTLQCNYIRQAIDIFEGLLMDLEEKDLNGPHLERLITFSAMWALGGLLELDDRLKLQQHLEKNGRLPLPRCGPNDTIFEFVVDQKGEWVHWETRVPLYTYPTDQTPEYTGILVPNVDNTRTDFLVDIIAKQAKPVLLIGEQGTAKTVIIKGYCSKYDPEAHIFKTINFSSATTPNMFQRAIESYVDKRVGTTYGPASGKKMTVFIDDINMPTINEWGDQITNEITRQMIEMSGFYNLDKPGDFTTIVDIQMVAAMNHPGGGRNDIPQRLKRQFSVFNCTLPSNASLDKVFGTLCLGHFCTERGFTESVIDTAQKLIGATRKVWQRVKIKMLPTPAKFHYVFNLRDVSRIWQGMLSTSSEVINSPQTLLALWKHECTRVIADRFTEPADRKWFDKMLHEVGSEECPGLITPSTWEEHYFVDFLRDAPEATGDEAEDVDLEAPKIYEAIESFQQLESRLTMFMNLYNEAIRGSKLDLVFFTDAMVHLVKISRVIRTSKGHALLVGVGGSGKQSLTRLASFIAGYKTFQITLTRSYNVNDLTEDLKYLYRTAGQKGSGITFIFTDNDIKDEAFLEYLNNMLSSGEIANLFARDEMDEILQELVAPMKKEFPRRPITNETLSEYYTSRVVKNLHIVLCFSPVGQKFRSRSLKFPGLISGCTMDWFQRWPRDALVAVSNHFLSRFDIVCNPIVKQAVVQTMGVFQDTVAEACIEYFQRFRRQTHVTPKSYLSFINGYMEIYGQKRKEIELLFERMNGGLKKLVEATESVNELSKQLVEKEKELQVANRKSEEVLEEVTVKATAAQKVKAQVQLVKDKAQTLVDAISVDKANSEEKLEAAKPALMEAEAALETIKPIHISTVRKLGKPPHLIMRIMDCVLLLFQKHMDRVVADPEHACPKPSWGEALKMMGGANFLNGLLNFPKVVLSCIVLICVASASGWSYVSSGGWVNFVAAITLVFAALFYIFYLFNDLINEETVELMEPYFQMDDYNMEQARRVCGDVAGLCSWTKAMASFFAVNKEVLPLKAMLARQENRLAGAMKELAVAQGQLDEKQRELNIVQAEYDRAMADKQRLMDEADACRRKMTNATALIGGLAAQFIFLFICKSFHPFWRHLIILLWPSYLIRWTEASKLFTEQINRLVGDVLLATGFLSYTGPFNQEFRSLLTKHWRRELVQNKIPFSEVSFFYLQLVYMMRIDSEDPRFTTAYILSSSTELLRFVHLSVCIWEKEIVLNNWRELVIVATFKKEARSECGNHKRIRLTPVVMRLLASLCFVTLWWLVDVNFITMLVDNATLSEWNVQGLPTDELSVQNGLVVTRATRYPLLIDPQGQGKAWIKRKEEANELQITSLNHKYFRTHLEDALALGRPLLIEDVGEELDPALDNILEKNFIKSGSALKVKLGDKECEVLKGFRLYITTKLPNPAYTPEIYARTAVIDFTVTRRGLEDQLLGLVIMTEKKELETERTKLLEQVAANRRKMKELEDNLLYRLTTTEGSLVEDESLIEMLQITKATSEEVQEKLNVAAETEVKINAAREEFRPVAARGSLLYFLVVEMSMVNVMYQTSLRQFLGLFDLSMARSEKSPINQKRIANIIDYLTFLVYRYTARGFYELDKFTFTVFLTLKIAMHRGEVNNEEFQIFIKGGAALDLNAVKPKPKKWIQDMTWLNLVELSKLPQFAQLTNQISADDKNWKSWFDSNAPEEASLPNGYDRLTTFHRLLLIRSWCPDRCLPMAKRYTAEALGPSFAEGVITNLEEMLEEADARTPMICFLSMGSDPTDNIERLAKKMGLKCGAISMGQGQEVHARRLLSCSMQEGRWILLQNCHLGLNFMDELLETITTSDGVHDAFRCWLTTEVNPLFPISLLQSSIKFTYDPPMGIRAGLRRTYATLTQDQLEISSLPQWKPLLYGVAFLHTTVQERRKFGPIGWNIPYEFNQADFTSTVQFVQNHLDEVGSKKPISWPTVRYMIGEVQYGGRVTDDYDKRLLNTYAKVWFSDAMFTDNFEFYRGYNIPKCRTLEEYQAYIEGLPLFDSPECFGLHPNADITYSTNTTNSMLDTIVSIQPKDSGGGTGETRESNVYRLANEILEKVPEDYNPFQVKECLIKMDHLKPLHIFLKQEIDRMQKVITIVRTTLTDLKLAIDGTIVMSENLRDALDSLFDARIPSTWRKISWESATLGFWFTDLLDRNAQFSSWLFQGRPISYWMTGFFNPQGFLTAMRQEVARANKYALDDVELTNEVTKLLREEVVKRPVEGVYVHGLWLDGAGWDRKLARLVEPAPKLLYTALPVVHVSAYSRSAGNKNKATTVYSCPVYKKPKRTDLNYIFPLALNSSVDPDHWILRGVALLCDVK
ncbi:hypothetical protein T265_06922 [Opisthorchis viverrini]|uniref:AAA+ ATPase domain-containing protein n=1 Tax=Opisthorchis viverrini TaxID=6198 RepID=A0A074ZQT3_OPIVI|nr:hypothetical protein T265_06922 [Opisthorchis viverrini]KER25690.1 hypothetical protein T265_06922 [Opisthorchis viverrini]